MLNETEIEELRTALEHCRQLQLAHSNEAAQRRADSEPSALKFFSSARQQHDAPQWV
jgi:hypothetical protein